jgi:hypothetical protein
MASIGQAATTAFPGHKWVRQWRGKRKVQNAVEKYIPYVTARDRQIVGYLLHHRQKTFTCAHVVIR